VSGDDAALRRLAILVGAAVLIDTTFYAVVAPLLPSLSQSLHLSKLGAGLLTACYPAGMLVASIPGGMLSVRMGPRFAVCLGLALLFASTVAFALLHSAPTLDFARFVEGGAGACSWAGGIAWLMAVAPSSRRGAVIGRAMSAAIAGAVAGPAIGALASAVGRAALFSALALFALALALVTWQISVPAGESHPEPTGAPMLAATRALLRRRFGLAALWLMALPAMVSGTLTVLGPLALHPLGAGAGVIGATFIAAAALETIVSNWVGGVSDRHGRLAPLIGSLAVAGTAIACFSAASDVPLLILVIGVSATALGAAWTPAMALLSDLSEGVGLDQALGAGLMNVAWAAGQIVGSGGSGALAHLTGNTFPTVLIGALCLLSAAWLLGTGGRPDPPVSPPVDPPVAVSPPMPGRAYRRSGPLGPGPARRSSRTRG
jgi:predicted MFS family arabinose efflux permease